jgi:hypothetical protein
MHSPNTIPPAKKLPSGPGVAVNPQLLALLPVNVENTNRRIDNQRRAGSWSCHIETHRIAVPDDITATDIRPAPLWIERIAVRRQLRHCPHRCRSDQLLLLLAEPVDPVIPHPDPADIRTGMDDQIVFQLPIVRIITDIDPRIKIVIGHSLVDFTIR